MLPYCYAMLLPADAAIFATLRHYDAALFAMLFFRHYFFDSRQRAAGAIISMLPHTTRRFSPPRYFSRIALLAPLQRYCYALPMLHFRRHLLLRHPLPLHATLLMILRYAGVSFAAIRHCFRRLFTPCR